ncbi:MAG: hypothetical protein KKB21_03160 [Nanoarchaeota archaeon]|nr:hypothetical protein [Nanoarchaeota archaeon]
MSGQWVVNSRISFDGWAEYERDEVFGMMQESITGVISKLYGRTPQRVNDSRNNLVVFCVHGEEVGRVQQDLGGLSYRVLHPEMSLDDLFSGIDRFLAETAA